MDTGGEDFNITLQIQDRNRVANNSNWRYTRQFAQLVSDLSLLNINIQGRSFPWTNDRESPAGNGMLRHISHLYRIEPKIPKLITKSLFKHILISLPTKTQSQNHTHENKNFHIRKPLVES